MISSNEDQLGVILLTPPRKLMQDKIVTLQTYIFKVIIMAQVKLKPGGLSPGLYLFLTF